jgi:hypothetical protein
MPNFEPWKPRGGRVYKIEAHDSVLICHERKINPSALNQEEVDRLAGVIVNIANITAVQTNNILAELMEKHHDA